MLSPLTAFEMPQMMPDFGAYSLGDPQAKTACNQMAFFPTELMLLKGWKFGSVGRGERLGWRGSSGWGCWGTRMGWGRLSEYVRIRLSGFGLWLRGYQKPSRVVGLVPAPCVWVSRRFGWPTATGKMDLTTLACWGYAGHSGGSRG